MFDTHLSLFTTPHYRQVGAEKIAPSGLTQLSGSIAKTVADNSSWGDALQTRVSLKGFEGPRFAIRTRESGGVPIQLLTSDNKTVTVNLCPNSLRKRFPHIDPQKFPEFIEKRQRPTTQDLHATLQSITANAPKISQQDLKNALLAADNINKNSPDGKISQSEYNQAHPENQIPRSIFCVKGKPYLALNRTQEGDPEIATTNTKQVRYCLGLHDNKLYAFISEKIGANEFEVEIPALQKLQGVPNIVQFHGDLEATSEKRGESKKYLIETLYSGDLSKGMSEDKKLPTAKKLTAALAKMHKQGIIHRDLKPDNVFIDSSGEPFIGDFGTSCGYVGDKHREHRTGGTVPFMAPEFARAHLSPRKQTSQQEFFAMMDLPLDVYGMGCVLHELFIGSVQQSPNFPPLGRSRDSTLQILTTINQDWMEEPKDTNTLEGRRNHIIWSMLRANPADRITAAQAASRFAAL